MQTWNQFWKFILLIIDGWLIIAFIAVLLGPYLPITLIRILILGGFVSIITGVTCAMITLINILCLKLFAHVLIERIAGPFKTD